MASNVSNSNNFLIPTNTISFDQFYNLFKQNLSQSQIWSNQLDSSGVNTFASNVASLGVSCEFYTERRLQEAFIDTAQSPLAIYEAVNFLGGTIIGNIPAQANLLATNPSLTVDVTFDAFTLFGINGSTFYINAPVTVPKNSSGFEFTVTEGNPVTLQTVSTGSANQVFFLSQNYLANSTANVTVATTAVSTPIPWDQVTNLWLDGYSITPGVTPTYSPLAKFQSALLPTGQVQILFGDGIHGQIPPVNNIITITVFQASGGLINNPTGFTATVTQYVGPNSQAEVAAVTLLTTSDGIFGGSAKPSPLFYKQVAPASFASNDRFVTAQDFGNGALLFNLDGAFPVKAARALGERDIHPGNVALANTVTLVLVVLPQLFTSEFVKKFSTYIATKSVFGIISPILAVPVTFTFFRITIILESTQISQQQLQINIKNALISLVGAFTNDTLDNLDLSQIQSSALGAKWFISDFYNAIVAVIGSNKCVIDYSFEGISTDFVLAYYQYLYLDFNTNPADNNSVRINFRIDY